MLIARLFMRCIVCVVGYLLIELHELLSQKREEDIHPTHITLLLGKGQAWLRAYRWCAALS